MPFCSKDIPILTLESKVSGYPCLQTDSTAGLRDAIEHLIIHHNRKHICFVAGRKTNEDALERLNVYRTTMKAHNIPVTEDMIWLPCLKMTNHLQTWN